MVLSELFRDILSAKEWSAYAPSIIGISTLFTPSYQNMLDIAQWCRDLFTKAFITAGGGVPTNMYNEIYRASKCFDALCYGEGEKPLLGLVEAIDKKEFLRNSLSWITRDKAEKKQSFKYDFIDNLDEIPILDYALLNVDDYILNQIQSLFPQQKNVKSMPYLSSRGCPYRCCFCSSHTVHGREMRYHSHVRIKEDFKYLRDAYRTKTIVFQDDHFLSNKKEHLKLFIYLMNFK